MTFFHWITIGFLFAVLPFLESSRPIYLVEENLQEYDEMGTVRADLGSSLPVLAEYRSVE